MLSCPITFEGRLLCVLPHARYSQPKEVSDPTGLELLGVKWLPLLTAAQAKELTPYEVGQPQWRASIKKLTTEAAIIVVLRGLDAAKRVKTVLEANSSRRSTDEVVVLPKH